MLFRSLAKKVSKAIQNPPLNNSKTTLKRKPSSSSEESSDDDDVPVTKIPAVSKLPSKKPTQVILLIFIFYFKFLEKKFIRGGF